jgi:hypothetical protein
VKVYSKDRKTIKNHERSSRPAEKQKQTKKQPTVQKLIPRSLEREGETENVKVNPMALVTDWLF